MLITHSMEEADALSNRIGIMVNGRLEALGTPQELKSQHGNGFTVEIYAKDNLDAVRDFFVSNFEGSSLVSTHAGAVGTFAIPLLNNNEKSAKIALLAKLFSKVEAEKDNLGISDY